MRVPGVRRKEADQSLLFVLNRRGNAANAADDLDRCGFDLNTLAIAGEASENDELAAGGYSDEDVCTFAAALHLDGMQIQSIAHYADALQVHKDLIAVHDDIADIARLRVLLAHWDQVVRVNLALKHISADET